MVVMRRYHNSQPVTTALATTLALSLNLSPEAPLAPLAPLAIGSRIPGPSPRPGPVTFDDHSPVSHWLAQRGLSAYAQAFAVHGYHGASCAEVLAELSDDERMKLCQAVLAATPTPRGMASTPLVPTAPAPTVHSELSGLAYRSIAKKVQLRSLAEPKGSTPQGHLKKGELLHVLESMRHPLHGLCLRGARGWVTVWSPSA
jgi:hypothetical protein